MYVFAYIQILCNYTNHNRVFLKLFCSAKSARQVSRRLIYSHVFFARKALAHDTIT